MRIQSTLIVVLITFIIYLSLTIIFLSRHNFNPGTMIHLGSKFIENTHVDPNLPVNYESGYDGQFFYRLSLDPLYRNSSLGPVLDAPAYRMQRILYPVLVHIISLGKRAPVPVNMIVVNLIFLLLIAFAGAKLAEDSGLSPLWGFALSLYPGFVFSLIVDTPEPVFTGLLLLSLLTIRLRMEILTTIFLSAAVLTRETTIIAVLAVSLAFSIQYFLKNDYELKWHNAIVPLIVFLSWQTIIYFRWGHPAFYEGTGNIGIPFAGFLNASFNMLKSSRNLSSFLDLLFLFGYLITGLITIYFIIRSGAGLHEKIIFLSYGLFSTLLSAPIYEYRGGFLRVFSEFYITAIPILLSISSTLKKVFIVYWIALFSGIAFLYGFIH